ncbi:MAG: NHL repeat-containing protein [Vicinamibacteria bacterium]
MSILLRSLLILWSLAWLGGEAAAADASKFRFVTAIYLDAKGVGLRLPEGVACNDRSTLIVADTAQARLLRFTVEDRDVKPAGEMRAPQLTAPIRVQMNSREEVFALDGKQRRIVKFDEKGEPRGYLDPEGVPGSASIVPRSFKIDRDGNIYLLDVFSARVVVLGPDGKFLRQIEFPKGYGFFSDLAVDSQGRIYLVDSLRAEVQVAAKDAKGFSLLAKNLRAHLSFPTSVAVDGRGVLYLVDEHGGGIVLVAQDGAVLGRQLAMGWNEGLLNSPSQMCLNDKGQVFIADRGNNRVQVFSIVR